jgi:hypothetical protein
MSVLLPLPTTIVAAVAHSLTYPFTAVQAITFEGRIDDVTRSRFDLCDADIDPLA